MIDLERFEKALCNLPDGIKEAEISIESLAAYSVDISDGEFADASYASSNEIFVRCSGDKTGYYYTQDLNEDVYEMLINAYRNGFAAEDQKIEYLNGKSDFISECESCVDDFEKLRKHLRDYYERIKAVFLDYGVEATLIA